jgi:hypothetical protein
MAVLNYEHFDLYANNTSLQIVTRGYVITQGVVLRSTAARTGPGFFSTGAGGGNATLLWPLPSARSVIGQAVAMRHEGAAINSDSSKHSGLQFIPASGNIVRVVNGLNGKINVYVGDTLVGSSPTATFAQNTWFHLEAKVVAGAGDGSVEVRFEGSVTPLLNITGLTINPIVNVALGRYGAGNSNIYYFDDWVVWDDTGTTNNTFMGDTFVIVAGPVADATSPNAWATSTGSAKWSLVDEEIPNDADFIIGNAVGDEQEFTHTQVNLPVGSVAAIAVQTRALKTDAGASSIELGIASGTSTSMSGEAALGTSASTQSHIANTNPDGGVPWTQAAAQAARLRVRRAA